MTDWRTSHPFKVGQRIRRRGASECDPASTVTMRGEDSHGQWIAIDGNWQWLSVGLFEAVEHEAVTA